MFYLVSSAVKAFWQSRIVSSLPVLVALSICLTSYCPASTFLQGTHIQSGVSDLEPRLMEIDKEIAKRAVPVKDLNFVLMTAESTDWPTSMIGIIRLVALVRNGLLDRAKACSILEKNAKRASSFVAAYNLYSYNQMDRGLPRDGGVYLKRMISLTRSHTSVHILTSDEKTFIASALAQEPIQYSINAMHVIARKSMLPHVEYKWIESNLNRKIHHLRGKEAEFWSTVLRVANYRSSPGVQIDLK